MKIGLSGQSGFLGTNLLTFLAQKHDVLIFPEVNRTLITYEKKIEISKCDAFIHAAEPASNENYTGEFMHLAMENGNVLGTLLRERLIYVSSVLVYGLGNSIPHGENDLPKPFNNYTEHKTRLENHLKKFDSRTFRLSNLVGIGMHGSTVIRQISQKIAKNEVFEIEPTNQRDYIYITDVCEIFDELLLNFEVKMLNIGSGISTSVRELVQILQAVGFPDKKKLKVQEKSHEEKSCIPNVSLLQSLLPNQRYTPLSVALKPTLSKEFL